MTRRITPTCSCPSKYGDKVTLFKHLVRELFCQNCHHVTHPFSHAECSTCPLCRSYERLGGYDR